MLTSREIGQRRDWENRKRAGRQEAGNDGESEGREERWARRGGRAIGREFDGTGKERGRGRERGLGRGREEIERGGDEMGENCILN